MVKPALMIQAGAGRLVQDAKRARRIQIKIKKILGRAYGALRSGSALEAVTLAVRLLEDDPEFNAGTGSMLQADGRARLSASIMDGARLRFAAVINLEQIKNPILAARALLEKKDRVLASDRAFGFAKEIGLRAEDPRTARAVRRWKKWKEEGFDTVGACALDRWGNLASATSTGGRGFEHPGRVSDSGMPVATYADSFCAVSATGVGEEIMDEGLAVRIAVRAKDSNSLSHAFRKTFREVKSHGRRMGAVGVDRRGNIACGATTEILFWGWQKGNRQKLFSR